jgi:drug/metabolite transporter (DMT)-like permease
MRRLATTDALLLISVVIWSLNITVTRYLLTEGIAPLAYSSLRYGCASVLFVLLGLALERTLRVRGQRAATLVGSAAVLLWANQIAFPYAVDMTNATTVALVIGTVPIFTALIASAAGLERLAPRYWIAASASFGGVVLVAAGSQGGLRADLGGVMLAVATAATWSAYSVTVTPLMRTNSALGISAVVIPLTWIPLMASGSGQVANQDFGFGALFWLSFAFTVIGPLVLTTFLWFIAIARVGPSHASLFANLQPFIAAIFALLILSEELSTLQVAGGFAIGAGLLLARARTVPAPVE